MTVLGEQGSGVVPAVEISVQILMTVTPPEDMGPYASGQVGAGEGFRDFLPVQCLVNSTKAKVPQPRPADAHFDDLALAVPDESNAVD
jgi:hypothetical protein